MAEGDLEPDPVIVQRIRMKPMRTQSGVAPVTVLTAPAVASATRAETTGPAKSRVAGRVRSAPSSASSRVAACRAWYSGVSNS